MCEHPYYSIKQDMSYPCGVCPACRKALAIDWSIRLLHEQQAHDKSCFITLTYDNDHLPMEYGKGQLCKDDYQRFLKRLRKHFSGTKIRYYLCGEYGPTTMRPHYHAILFGLSEDDLLPQLIPDNSGRRTSRLLAGLWPNGYNTVSGVGKESIEYVAGYCQKKLRNKVAYANLHLVPAFAHGSLGLGKQFALSHADSLRRDLSIRYKGFTHRIPRYYRKLLNITAADYLPYFGQLKSSLYKEYSQCKASALSLVPTTLPISAGLCEVGAGFTHNPGNQDYRNFLRVRAIGYNQNLRRKQELYNSRLVI